MHQVQPQALVAKTFKGKGFVGIEDKDNWHGKPLGDKSETVTAQLKNLVNGAPHPAIPAPVVSVPKVDLSVRMSEPPSYSLGEKVATRQTYGTALDSR